MTPPGPWQQCVELARKDLRIEARAGEALLVTAPFGAAALFLIPIALGAETLLLRQIGPGLYWAVVLLFGVLITVRQSAIDQPEQLSLLRLSGVPPAVRLTGHAIANAVLLLVFELLLLPVVVLLYDPDLDGWPWLLPTVVLVATGLAVLGALTDALAQGLGGRSVIGPLLVAPVALPLLLAATQVFQAPRYGRSPWPWLTLAVVVDLTVVLAMTLSARHLEELA